MKKIYLILFGLLSINLSVLCQDANFSIPDTVCVNQSIIAQNTTIDGSRYYWNFCSGNLGTSPIGINMGNLGSLNRPVYSAIAKDGDNYFVFITNNSDGSLTKLAFGNNLTNIPLSSNLGNLGIMGPNIEGIQIKRDDLTGNWYGLVTWWRIDNLVRLNFGNSLNNTPTAENLGNIDNSLSYAHTIYTFYEMGNWYSFIVNNGNSTIIRLNFGSSLSNFPTSTNLGNIGGLNGPVGLYPIQDNGIWYLFVVNRDGNTLSRLDFGNSLLNNPNGLNLGDVGGTMHYPRSVAFLKDCGKIFGFVVNEATNDIVRLTFPDGLLSSPTAFSLGNIADFSFPHHISEFFRVGDSLYTFITNVNNNTISRLCFASCKNSTISSSNLRNPPAFSYNTPGTYNVSLVVDEGLPTQSNICKNIYVKAQYKPDINGDSILCIGEALNLTTSPSPDNTYLWSGPNGFSSTSQSFTIPAVTNLNAGKYSLAISGCSNLTADKNVSVVGRPTFIGDTTICAGNALSLVSTPSPDNSFLWTGPNGFTSVDQVLSIPVFSAINVGMYTLTVSGCSSFPVNMKVSIIDRPSISGDTMVCIGGSINLSASPSPGNSYFWTGPNGFTSSSQTFTIPIVNSDNAGKYTLSIGGCTNLTTDKIVGIIAKPLVTGDTVLCVGDTLKLSPKVAMGGSYKWTGPNGFTSTSKNLMITSVNTDNSGIYNYSSSECPNSSVDIRVTVTNPPIVDLGSDTIICQGYTIVLNAGNIGSKYQWNTGAISQTIPVELPGSYNVTVSTGSCQTHDEISVDNCGTELWFPNVFTPNGDGLNERFKPVSLGIIEYYQIVIYNRWGQQLYESTDPLLGWDGTYKGANCPVGAYYYVVEYSIGKQSASLRQYVKRGSVTIVR